MKPTGFQTTGNYTGQTNREDLALHMYGAPNSSASVANYVPAVCTGQELGLQRYYTVYTEKTPVATGNDYGFPQYNSFCNEYNAMDMIGKPVVQQTHNFEYAPLHQRANNYQIPALTVGDNPATLPASLPANIALLDGTRIEMPRQKIFPTIGAGQATDGIDENCAVVDLQAGGTSAGFGNVTNFAGTTMYTKFPMEQSGVYIEKNRKGSDYNAQQSIHIGVRAVPKLGTAVNLIEANSWLDCQMYWTVEAELEVSAADPFTFPRGRVADIPPRAQMCFTNTTGTNAVPRLFTYDRPYFYGRAQTINNTEVV